MTDNAQPMTASMLCLLPRILPAPQALLKPTRPTRLPSYKAQVIGIHSGVVLDSVGSFANIIHPLEDQAPFSFRVLEIRHKDEGEGDSNRPGVGRDQLSWSERLLPRSTTSTRAMMGAAKGIPRTPPLNAHDVEKGSGSGQEPMEPKSEAAAEPVPGIQRRRTVKEQMTEFVANPTLKHSQSSPEARPRPAVPPKLGSPIHIITLFSFFLTLVICGLTAYWRDGNALLAVSIISLQASLVGYASWWKPQLTARPARGASATPPPGNMMIRTRGGAFVLVRCREEVARELYTGAEECEYHVGATPYRYYMAAGTALLMVGVVLLGNTGFDAQALVAGSYIVLNGAYWLLGMLPRRHFWDLSRYVWEDVTPSDARNADKITTAAAAAAQTARRAAGHGDGDGNSLCAGGGGEEEAPSFTRTLWYAIRETNETWWVERSGAAPSTAQWQQWLREAGAAARAGQRGWPAVARKNQIMYAGAGAGDGGLPAGAAWGGGGGGGTAVVAGAPDEVAAGPEQRAPVTVPGGGTSAAPAPGSL